MSNTLCRPHPRRRHRQGSHPRWPPHPRSPARQPQPQVRLRQPQGRLRDLRADRRRAPRQDRRGPEERVRWRAVRRRELAHPGRQGLLIAHCRAAQEAGLVRQCAPGQVRVNGVEAD